eukprot:TRINITY_DN1929_c0_g1_i2.p1 TRINITY_DN1929_c0_g1~~TRINITY_DN1929_c0_g1_i2.p1  ORF type:complete len:278 (+),score=40.88 TRINITY_DN1929_c0_g1_i2:66-836(+)
MKRTFMSLGIIMCGVVLLLLSAALAYVHMFPWLGKQCCLHNITHEIVATRLICSFVASVFFGLLRQMSFKPVGFASFVIVSLGACCLGLTVVEIKVDKLEVGLLSAGVTGIGFLGSGAFIKQKTTGKIHGFTNGACIWIFAVFGIAIGLGEYDIFGLTYVMLLGTVFIDAYFEKYSMGSYQKRVEITTNKIVPVKAIETTLQHITLHFKLVTMGIEKGSGGGKMRFVFLVEGNDLIHRLPEYLSTQSWYESGAIGG